MAVIEKVVAFCVRGDELLVFDHPTAGLQVPAGTVERGEPPRDAALRELQEETGIERATIIATLAVIEEMLGERQGLSNEVLTANDGRTIPRGWPLKLSPGAPGQTRFRHETWDWECRPPELLDLHEGEAPSNLIASRVRRHFFLLETDDERCMPWGWKADGWEWTVQWQAIHEVQLSGAQRRWLDLVRQPEAT